MVRERETQCAAATALTSGDVYHHACGTRHRNVNIPYVRVTAMPWLVHWHTGVPLPRTWQILPPRRPAGRQTSASFLSRVLSRESTSPVVGLTTGGGRISPLSRLVVLKYHQVGERPPQRQRHFPPVANKATGEYGHSCVPRWEPGRELCQRINRPSGSAPSQVPQLRTLLACC